MLAGFKRWGIGDALKWSRDRAGDAGRLAAYGHVEAGLGSGSEPPEAHALQEPTPPASSFINEPWAPQNWRNRRISLGRGLEGAVGQGGDLCREVLSVAIKCCEAE